MKNLLFKKIKFEENTTNNHLLFVAKQNIKIRLLSSYTNQFFGIIKYKDEKFLIRYIDRGYFQIKEYYNIKKIKEPFIKEYKLYFFYEEDKEVKELVFESYPYKIYVGLKYYIKNEKIEEI